MGGRFGLGGGRGGGGGRVFMLRRGSKAAEVYGMKGFNVFWDIREVLSELTA